MHQAVLHFWFHDITPAQWWKVDPVFDRQIAERFGQLHQQACKAELYEWRADPRGRLAEVIVLDQFSRNIHRGDPRAFEADPLALALAQTAVAAGDDLALSEAERAILYMPYVHSESPRIHSVADELLRRTPPKTATASSSGTKPSSTASAATRTAIRSWAAPPRPKSRRFWSRRGPVFKSSGASPPSWV